VWPLALPPELRNNIYDHLARSSSKIVYGNGLFVDQTLTFSKTCHQIRDEYLTDFKTYVQRETPTLEVWIENFDFEDTMDLFSNLNPLPKKAKRLVKMQFYFTDLQATVSETTDSFLHWLQYHQQHSAAQRLKVRYSLVFDWASEDDSASDFSCVEELRRRVLDATRPDASADGVDINFELSGVERERWARIQGCLHVERRERALERAREREMRREGARALRGKWYGVTR